MSPLLDTEKVADRLFCTQRHVRNLIQRGELEAFRIGKDYRITEESFQSYLKKTKVDPEKFAE